jgi:hypothetical protein
MVLTLRCSLCQNKNKCTKNQDQTTIKIHAAMEMPVYIEEGTRNLEYGIFYSRVVVILVLSRFIRAAGGDSGRGAAAAAY